MTTENHTPTPLASTAMEAARAIHDRRNPSFAKLAIPDAIFREYLADAETAFKHFQPLLTKVEGERDSKPIKDAAHAAGILASDPQIELDVLRLNLTALRADLAAAKEEIRQLTATNLWRQEEYEKETDTTSALRADLTAKEADTAILDWLEAKSKFITSINGTHRGYHELPSVAIDYWTSGGVTAGLGMTPCTLRAAVAAIIKREQSALTSRADKGGAT